MPRNTYGSMGLVDMPNARMAPDGELSAGAFFTQNIQRYNLGFQALPWLELSFRYSGLNHFHPPYSVYYDRSFGLKARLWDETDVLPAVVVGVNDVVGTGVYGGEYVAASKQFGPFDATLGMGWGRLGSTGLLRNPFTLISSSFIKRPTFASGATDAGGTNFSSLFHGRDVGLFGGVAWATPVDGLSLVGEYSSDAYTEETANGAFRPHTQLNLGLSYQLADTVNASVSWLYGRAVGGSLSFQMDPVHDPYPQRLGTPPPEPRVRTAEEQRAALENLTRVHDTGAIVSAQQRSRGFMANNQLVDRLLQMPGLSDVSLRGHVIVLSIARGDPDATCRSAARFIGQYDTAITGVSVSRGNVSRQCPVVAGLPLVERLPRDTGFQPLLLSDITATAPLLTIDATHVRTAASDAAAVAKIRADAVTQHVGIAAIRLTRTEAIVYYANTFYFSEKEALERLTKVLMQDAPDDIEKFRMISTITGRAVREFDVLRAPAERTVSQAGDIDLATDMTQEPAPMDNPVLSAAARKGYPQFSWSVYPQFRQQLFDPNNPFGVQFLGAVDASLQLAPGLFLSAEAEANVWDNFRTDRPPSSALPHVRTDFLRYFTEGKNGLGYLAAEYRFRVAPTVFASFRAGYLESMFAGAGGEMLWRPEGQRWALGVDAFEVQQRDFDRLFGLQSYRAFTGHVSLYYQSPWYDLNFTVRAGQYLAHDRGLSVEVTRRFDTGVEVGAFFTKTNVSAEQFGEGSFDKGIIIRIPLNWVAPINTQSTFDLDLRPVQRDGGQRLNGDARLYNQTMRTSYGQIWDELNEHP